MTVFSAVAGDPVPPVMAIPSLTHAEAGQLAQTEVARVLALLGTLEGDDWSRPTYCTDWTVRQMVAHLAGAVTGSTSLGEFLRQNVLHPYTRRHSDPVDGTNRLQVEERAAMTTEDLIAEFRRNGQAAVDNRQRLPWWVRKIRLPMGSLGFAPIEYLMGTIYPRDQWMHRYDICAATGKRMVVTPEHDGRIVALVLRDIAAKLDAPLRTRSITLRLTGELEDVYRFGAPDMPHAEVEMDGFDFNLAASGRIPSAEAPQRAHISGDIAVAEWFLGNMAVPY